MQSARAKIPANIDGIQNARRRKIKNASDFWVCCDNCGKWRRLPGCRPAEYQLIAESKQQWLCSDNKWDSATASCSVPEEVSLADEITKVESDFYDQQLTHDPMNKRTPKKYMEKSPDFDGSKTEGKTRPYSKTTEKATPSSSHSKDSKATYQVQSNSKAHASLGGLSAFSVVFSPACMHIAMLLANNCEELPVVDSEFLVSCQWIAGMWTHALSTPLPGWDKTPVSKPTDQQVTSSTGKKRLQLIRRLADELNLYEDHIIITKEIPLCCRIVKSTAQIPPSWKAGPKVKNLQESALVRALMSSLTDSKFSSDGEDPFQDSEERTNHLNSVESSMCEIIRFLWKNFLEEFNLSLDATSFSSTHELMYEKSEYEFLYSPTSGPSNNRMIKLTHETVSCAWRIYVLMYFVEKGMMTSSFLSDFLRSSLEHRAFHLDLRVKSTQRIEHPLRSRLVFEAASDQVFRLINNNGDVDIVPSFDAIPSRNAIAFRAANVSEVSESTPSNTNTFNSLSPVNQRKQKSESLSVSPTVSTARVPAVPFAVGDAQVTDFDGSVETEILGVDDSLIYDADGTNNIDPQLLFKECQKSEKKLFELEAKISGFCPHVIENSVPREERSIRNSKFMNFAKDSVKKERPETKVESYINNGTSLLNIIDSEVICSEMSEAEKITALYIFCLRSVREESEREVADVWAAMSMWCPVLPLEEVHSSESSKETSSNSVFEEVSEIQEMKEDVEMMILEHPRISPPEKMSEVQFEASSFTSEASEKLASKGAPVAEEKTEVPEVPEVPKIPKIPEVPEVPKIPEVPEVPEIKVQRAPHKRRKIVHMSVKVDDTPAKSSSSRKEKDVEYLGSSSSSPSDADASISINRKGDNDNDSSSTPNSSQNVVVKISPEQRRMEFEALSRQPPEEVPDGCTVERHDVKDKPPPDYKTVYQSPPSQLPNTQAHGEASLSMSELPLVAARGDALATQGGRRKLWCPFGLNTPDTYLLQGYLGHQSLHRPRLQKRALFNKHRI